MTRLLHTADVHLKPDTPERETALRRLLDRAERDDIDVVTIGGDLFDQPETVEQLRTDLRNDLFADRPFEILLIPGNHDVAAFRGDVFFGDACTVVTEAPFEHWIAPDEDLRVTAIPYRERPDDDLLLALQDRDPFAGSEALLLHCSLDAPFEDYETGAEDTRRYFPVTEELLGELEFDYYLAGHYHSHHVVSFDDGAEFAYPGTPASTSSTETGQRRVTILDPSSGIDLQTLDTFHFATRRFTVTPGNGERLLEDVQEWSTRHAVDAAEASVHVDGFLATDEGAFHEALVTAADPATVTDDTRSVDHVLSHPLYRSFENELESMECDEETAEAVTDRTLEVFSELSVQGEI